MRVLLDVTLAAWALLELGVRVNENIRGRGRRHRDRGTRIRVALALAATVATAAVTRSAQPVQTWEFVRAAGIVVMWLGLALRIGAIAALGDSFRTTVEVDRDQAVVATGPYAWVRHPSYTGLLLIAAGFGVACRAWLSLLACVLLVVPALVRRIRVEETELDHVLGDAYRVYASQTTARLIPWVW